MDELKKFVYFHDWDIDILAVREGNRLTLGLKFDDRRATVTFVGTSRCAVEHFGLTNIVYDIKILQPGEARYDKALAVLAGTDRFSEKPGCCIAFVAATAGAELVVEFESMEIESA
jgi:hypothetical protein